MKYEHRTVCAREEEVASIKHQSKCLTSSLRDAIAAKYRVEDALAKERRENARRTEHAVEVADRWHSEALAALGAAKPGSHGPHEGMRPASRSHTPGRTSSSGGSVSQQHASGATAHRSHCAASVAPGRDEAVGPATEQGQPVTEQERSAPRSEGVRPSDAANDEETPSAMPEPPGEPQALTPLTLQTAVGSDRPYQ
jgi:hypothetical protein